jgi:hypothetical protein
MYLLSYIYIKGYKRMTDANNTEDTPRNGRRATDNQPDEVVFPSKTSGLWSVVRNSVGVALALLLCLLFALESVVFQGRWIQM